MNPRRFLNFFRSPTGALTLFLIGLLIVLLLVNSRRPSTSASSTTEKNAPPHGGNTPQLPTTVRRDMVPFNAADKEPKPPAPTHFVAAKPQPTPPPLPPLSLVAETPAPPAKDAKTFSADFAPFGRLVPCELVVTVDSAAIQTPIIGLVTEDIFHHGQLIIPAGTEVHGSATVNRARERIASNGRWTLVWQSGEELNVSGLALDHEIEPDTGTWAITDGSAGLRGKLIKSDNLAEVKLFAAALLSGASEAFTEKRSSEYGSYALPTLQNASLKGVQSVLDRYAQQIQQTIERDGFYVRVPAGKQFYLYITQTVDRSEAQIGGTTISTLPPGTATPEKSGDASHTTSQPSRPALLVRPIISNQQSNP
jgi:hypothetical protein